MEKEENQNSTSVDQNHDKMSEAEKTDKKALNIKTANEPKKKPPIFAILKDIEIQYRLDI